MCPDRENRRCTPAVLAFVGARFGVPSIPTQPDPRSAVAPAFFS